MIPRMRTIPDVVKYFKALDENTAVTENFLRNQIRNGTIPFHKAGKRFLINLDSLESILMNPITNAKNKTEEKIRCIASNQKQILSRSQLRQNLSKN